MELKVDKADYEKGGIYMITNTIDERVYIGQAQHFYKRYLYHRANLKAGKHPNLLLQNFVLDHSVDELEFSVLEVTRYLDAREMHYIELYKSIFVGHGFNIAKCNIKTAGFDEKFRLNSLYLHYIKKGHQVELDRLEGVLEKYREHFRNIAASNLSLSEATEDAQYEARLYRDLYEAAQEDRDLWKQRFDVLAKQFNNNDKQSGRRFDIVSNQLCIFS